MLDNFFIVNARGDILFLKNYHGEPHSASYVMGLASVIKMLRVAGAKKQSNEEEKKETVTDTGALTMGTRKFVYSVYGSLVLVGQGPAGESEQFLRVYLRTVLDMLHFFLGDGETAPDTASPTASGTHPKSPLVHDASVRSLLDLVDYQLRHVWRDPALFVRHGSRWVFLASSIRDRVDRMLAALEGRAGVHGVALLLGHSVLHGRLPPATLHAVTSYVAARPLGNVKCRTLPVCTARGWRHLIVVRLRSFLLVVIAPMRTLYWDLQPHIEEFEESVVEASLQLPVEEPPVLLRHYSGHDTIALLYHDRATGITVAPPPRPGPRSEQVKMLRSFAFFCSRALFLQAASARASQSTMHMYGYKFFGRVTEDHVLFVLYAERVQSHDMDVLSEEIVANIQKHAQGVVSMG